MKENYPNEADRGKARQLNKHKALATGLFLLMVAVYVCCIWYQQSASGAWLGYVKAFAEAAMVGALADWFAVTALFHHPLGIPIPHTNLIENRKKRIGDNLGEFVADNFLNAGTIRPYIQQLRISAYVASWMEKEKNLRLLTDEISWLIKDVVENIDDAAVEKFLSYKSKEILSGLKLNEALAGSLSLIIQRGDHERILNYVLAKVHEYVVQNENLVRKRVKEESHFLIPGFVDHMIAAKITKGAARYIYEIENDPQHQIRKDINQQLEGFIQDIKTREAWQTELQELKDSLLAGGKIGQYAAAIWKSFQAGILGDLSGEKSAVKSYLKKSLKELAKNLGRDEVLRQKIDGWMRLNFYRYALKNRNKAAALISNTVGNWEGNELSTKLELEVGKDLQFIRINGTMVGGLVGLLIHLITTLVSG